MKERIERACRTIAPHVERTPLQWSAALGGAIGGEVYLKLENLQHSGSFKLRGVVNKIRSLRPADLEKLLVAASTGNHGAAFARAVSHLGLKGKLFVPETTTPVKLSAIEESGIPFEKVGRDCVETECHATAFARANDCVLVPPYNDPEIVAGQGTIGVELVDELESIDVVLVPVGGGGLISGIGGYLKAVSPATRVVGCQPLNSCVMHASIEAGRIVEAESLPTLADGTSGGIEPGSITFDFCRRWVDEFVLLSEEEILAAIRLLADREDLVVEGAAALSVAALLKNGRRFAGRRVVLIISGGRIDDEVLRRIGRGREHEG